MNIRFLAILLFTISCFAQVHAAAIFIEPLQEERDMPMVEHILNEYAAVLAYETAGYNEGTTIGYLKNPDYMTDVLRVDGETVGFINYKVEWPPFILKWFMSPRGLIHLIGIEREYQRKGYGSLLLRHALKVLKRKNLSEVFLCVKKDNIVARAFYEKEGFICALPEQVRYYLEDLFYEKQL
jgi:ribosomal protein S18 acetylase RimI-like enzyme